MRLQQQQLQVDTGFRPPQQQASLCSESDTFVNDPSLLPPSSSFLAALSLSADLNTSAFAIPPVASTPTPADDSLSDLQWNTTQASMTIDALTRLAYQREEIQQRIRQEAEGLDAADTRPKSAHHRDLERRRRELEEEWLQAHEAALLEEASNLPFFTCPSTAARTDTNRSTRKPMSSLQRWYQHELKQSKGSSIPPPAPPPLLFHAAVNSTQSTVSQPAADASDRHQPLYPEQIYASVAFEALRTEKDMPLDVQHTLKLTLMQLSSLMEIGVIQLPFAASTSSHTHATPPRHPFLNLLDDVEERWKESGVISSAASDTIESLRQAYNARIIQGSFRSYRSRAKARQVRKDMSERLRMEAEQVEQARLRAREEAATERRMRIASRRIWCWYSYRSRMKRWANAWMHKGGEQLWRNPTDEDVRRVIRCQAIVRSFLVRHKLTTYKIEARQHRARRNRGSLWKKEQQVMMRNNDVQEQILSLELHFCREIDRCHAEEEKEHQKVADQFHAWEQKLHEEFFQKRPLPKQWIPQTDRHTGKPYWLNVNTGIIVHQHPFTNVVEEIKQKEAIRADGILQERLQALRDYAARLHAELEEHRRLTSEQFVAAASQMHESQHLNQPTVAPAAET